MRTRVGLALVVCLAAALPAGRIVASGGVLIPMSVGDQPDPSVLALRSMQLHVTVEDLHAEVKIEEVFVNKTASIVEGKYLFPLGERARLTGFALWEGDQRMQGAVVEKAHGKRIYEQLTRQSIDPGLLETSDDPESQGTFSLRVSPIPPFGTTRVELTYEEDLDVASDAARLTVPLAPRRYDAQTAGTLTATMDVTTPVPLTGLGVAPAAWFPPQQKAVTGTGTFHYGYSGHDVVLDKDLTIDLHLAAPANGLAGRLTSYRDPSQKQARGPFAAGAYVEDRGFFVARALFGGAGNGAAAAKAKPRDVVVLLDTSLSMQWDKLDVAVNALDELLGKRLRDGDRFGLVLFHDEVRPWKTKLTPWTAGAAGEALDFLRKAYLAGGTDLRGAIASGAALLNDDPRKGADRDLVIITDGHPTFAELDYRAIGAAAQKQLGGARVFVLGLGDDVNTTLLESLARAAHGAFTAATAAGDDGYAVTTFLDRLDQDTYHDVALELPAAAGVDLVYASATDAFAGGDVTWFGRYQTPQPGGKATVKGVAADDGRTVSATFDASLVTQDATHAWIARGWAYRRVRDLVDRIREDGEREDWIKEIIALSRRYGFVTPYTSFIAAPRAMLRPRNFQAGDPILRVKTGPEIKGVTAIFPFGLTKALAYVQGEDVWETRFLAPATMTDGSYGCTLVLTDAAGRKVREEKRFTIDSKPPDVKVSLSHGSARPGDRVVVTTLADRDVRAIHARLDDGPAVEVKWAQAAKASVGELAIPDDLPPGEHHIHVVAEDFARNTTIVTVTIVILGDK